MERRVCMMCGFPSFSAWREGIWECPRCGADILPVEEKGGEYNMAVRRPVFDVPGYCRVCGQQAMVSRSGLCEECWERNRKQQRELTITRRHVVPYLQRWANGEPAEQVLREMGEFLRVLE